MCFSVKSIYSLWQKKNRDGIMVQRHAARYATNCYHDLSCVLQLLDWESLESRTKIQLTLLFKVVKDLVDLRYQPLSISHQQVPEPERITLRNLRRSQLNEMHSNTDSFCELHHCGILCQPLWTRLLTW